MDRNSKVLVVHHNDLDGYGCAVLFRAVFKNCKTFPASFYDVDQKLKDIEYDKVDSVFVVDVHPTDVKCFDISEKIILIDHHPSEYNDPKKNRYVVTDKNKCATHLCWNYLKNKFPDADLSKFKKFVKSINEFDLWTNRTPIGKCLNELLYGMDDTHDKHFFIKRFKDGNVRFTKEEMVYLKKRRSEFNDIYNDLDVFELEKTKSCFIITTDFVNDLAHKLLHHDGYDFVFVKHPKKDRVSVRHKVDGVNIGKILDDLGYGGGHEKSAGFFENDAVKLRKKMLAIEIEILKALEMVA